MNDPIDGFQEDASLRGCYEEFGWVHLPGLVNAGFAAWLHDETMGIMDSIGLGQTSLRQTSEYLAGGAIDALVNSETLARIAGFLMGGDARLYLPFTAVKSPGGGGAFHFHQDNQYTRFDGPGINLWIATMPIDESNGCLWMVPHSHFVGTLPSVKDADGTVRDSGLEPLRKVPVRMSAGDAVAFTRLTVHGSSPNPSPLPRVAYAVQYARADVCYTRDHGASWHSIAEAGPGWRTGPVESLSVPES